MQYGKYDVMEKYIYAQVKYIYIACVFLLKSKASHWGWGVVYVFHSHLNTSSLSLYVPPVSLLSTSLLYVERSRMRQQATLRLIGTPRASSQWVLCPDPSVALKGPCLLW